MGKNMTDILTRLAGIEATDENGLLPCPHCGDNGQPLIWRVGNEATKERGCDVGCAECGFTKRIRVIQYSLEWAEERAIATWNARTREAALIALVQEAASEIERLRFALQRYADADYQGTGFWDGISQPGILLDMGCTAAQALKPQE